jgi:MoaA/NifB/PqqE/SkfB family radical SAM enzyme
MKPKFIRLDASSVCQLRCPVCHQSTDPAKIKNGFLKVSEFKKIIDDNPWIEMVELSGKGEIFLNPNLLEIIRYGYEKKVLLCADNGANLNDVNEDVLEGLTKYRFHSIRCSLDGCCNETYKKYRVNGDFDRVINNIKRINKFKEQYNSQYPKLGWQFIIFGHNEHELLQAKEYARELKMDFYVKLNNNSEYSPVADENLVRSEVGYASREEYKEKTGEMYFSHVCNQLWDFPTISWDGEIMGCCINEEMAFGGNAFSEGLQNAINSDNMQYARRMLTGEKEPIAGIPCTTCKFYLHMKESGLWLKRTT